MATGHIKKWSADRGFGFIVDDASSESEVAVFFHINNSQELKRNQENLIEGAAVVFDKRPSTKKPGSFEAYNVRLQETPSPAQNTSASNTPDIQPSQHFHNPYTFVLSPPKHERIDEIRVITTLSGRNRIVQSLLHPQQGRFTAFCRDYGIDPASIAFSEETITLLRTPDGRMLDDIRSVDENGHAANQICEIVRELTRDPRTRLHASAAGGRKTMSIYLTAAMQLFGRAQDRLSHVLVSEPFETHPEFYYVPEPRCKCETGRGTTAQAAIHLADIPPEPRTLQVRDRQGQTRPLSTAQAAIHLADIPFIRLRGLIPDWMQRRDSDMTKLSRIENRFRRCEPSTTGSGVAQGHL